MMITVSEWALQAGLMTFVNLDLLTSMKTWQQIIILFNLYIIYLAGHIVASFMHTNVCSVTTNQIIAIKQ